MLANVCDDIKTVQSDLRINQVNKQTSENIYKLEAFYQMVLICSDKCEVSDDNNYHSQVFHKFNLCDILMENSDEALSFLSKLIECILLLLLYIDRLSAS